MSKQGVFEFMKFYNVSVTGNNISFHGRQFGNVRPLKSCFLCLDDSTKKILTLYNLRMRVMVIEWCCMHKRNRELIENIFYFTVK